MNRWEKNLSVQTMVKNTLQKKQIRNVIIPRKGNNHQYQMKYKKKITTTRILWALGSDTLHLMTPPITETKGTKLELTK